MAFKPHARKWTDVNCFSCGLKRVEPGKGCKNCGAKCYIAPDSRKRKRLSRIRHDEVMQEALAYLQILG